MMHNADTPRKIRTAGVFGGKLKSIFNALVDFAVQNRPLRGPGIEFNQTTLGTQISVSKELLELADQYNAARSGASDGDTTNVFNGGVGGGSGGGSTLPDTETNESGETTYNDQPLGWRTLKVCVSDGEGGYTPMSLDVYATNPY